MHVCICTTEHAVILVHAGSLKLTRTHSVSLRLSQNHSQNNLHSSGPQVKTVITKAATLTQLATKWVVLDYAKPISSNK